jgi:hypothetical protein
MQVIKDLNSRDIYAPLRQHLNPDIEPMEGPRVTVPLIQPAEDATEVGADDDKPPMTPAEALALCGLLTISGVAMLSLLVWLL